MSELHADRFMCKTTRNASLLIQRIKDGKENVTSDPSSNPKAPLFKLSLQIAPLRQMKGLQIIMWVEFKIISDNPHDMKTSM